MIAQWPRREHALMVALRSWLNARTPTPPGRVLSWNVARAARGWSLPNPHAMEHAMFICLSEQSSRQRPSASQIDTDEISDVLRLIGGCRVLEVPVDGPGAPSIEDALAYLSVQDSPTPAIYNGFIPSQERYEAVWEACARRNVWLLNTPAEFARCLSLEQAYPLLCSMTPRTVPITSLDGLDAALDEVGLPAFLKGSVKSLKKRGIRSCKAQTREEARRIAAELFEHTYFTRGTVLVRQWVELRHNRKTPRGLPMGREFRLFVYRGEVLGYGYYWETGDPMDTLTPNEEVEVFALARRAAAALDVPYLVLDVGHTKAGEFIIVEPGDAQFAGLSRVDPLAVFTRLVARARAEPPAGVPSPVG